MDVLWLWTAISKEFKGLNAPPPLHVMLKRCLQNLLFVDYYIMGEVYKADNPKPKMQFSNLKNKYQWTLLTSMNHFFSITLFVCNFMWTFD